MKKGRGSDMEYMSMDPEEIEEEFGGTDGDLTYGEILQRMKDFVRAARQWRRTYKDTLKMAIRTYGEILLETDIEACVRSAYAL